MTGSLIFGTFFWSLSLEEGLKAIGQNRDIFGQAVAPLLINSKALDVYI
jgi:hypothetical protein